MKNLDQYNGLPENYFIIDTASAPKEWPADEIDCSIARAGAVLELVVALLLCADRPIDNVLSNALWSVTNSIGVIGKLARHYEDGAISELAQQIDSTITLVMIGLDAGAGNRPADSLLSDTLKLIQSQLVAIKNLSDVRLKQ